MTSDFESQIKHQLADMELGRVGYFRSVESTNDLAASWANENVPPYSIIIADEQTKGRGRAGRAWYTPPGSALALTVILPSNNIKPENLPRVAGLGALAVSEALEQLTTLTPEIKWPNDVLLRGAKTCGVLAEAHWQGDQLQALILGIGINIAYPSIPPDSQLNFPATCVETETGQPLDRVELLKAVVSRIMAWHPNLETAAFIESWEAKLAYRNQSVRAIMGNAEDVIGQVIGLSEHGQLRLMTPTGEEVLLNAGEIRVRPL